MWTEVRHVFKNRSNRIVRQLLCYREGSRNKLGRATHKYDPYKCGFALTPGLLRDGYYTGPLTCHIRCHRHLWWKEAERDRCTNCLGPTNPATYPHPTGHWDPKFRAIPEAIIARALGETYGSTSNS